MEDTAVYKVATVVPIIFMAPDLLVIDVEEPKTKDVVAMTALATDFEAVKRLPIEAMDVATKFMARRSIAIKI